MHRWPWETRALERTQKDPIHSLILLYNQYLLSCCKKLLPGASETVVTKGDLGVLRLVLSRLQQEGASAIGGEPGMAPYSSVIALSHPESVCSGTCYQLPVSSLCSMIGETLSPIELTEPSPTPSLLLSLPSFLQCLICTICWRRCWECKRSF